MIALRVDAPRADVLEQVRHVALHVALVHAQREALVHRRADVDEVPRRAVDADRSTTLPPLRTASMHQLSAVGRAGLQLQPSRRAASAAASPSPRSPRRRCRRPRRGRRSSCGGARRCRPPRRKLIVSTPRVAPRELQPVVDVVDRDDAARAHAATPTSARTGRPGPQPKTTTVSPGLISPISAAW